MPLAFGGESPGQELDTGWPPILVAGALLLAVLFLVAIVVVVRQAQAAARAREARARKGGR